MASFFRGIVSSLLAGLSGKLDFSRFGRSHDDYRSEGMIMTTGTENDEGMQFCVCISMEQCDVAIIRNSPKLQRQNRNVEMANL